MTRPLWLALLIAFIVLALLAAMVILDYHHSLPQLPEPQPEPAIYPGAVMT